MQLDRRQFVGLGGAALVAAGLPGRVSGAPGRTVRRLRKSCKFGMVELEGSLADKFQLLAEVGFDGVELDSPNDLDDQEVLDAKAASGLEIPGVVDSVHWRLTLGDPDPEVRARGRAGLETALRDAKLYGGTTVLLVPAVVNAEISYDQAYTRSQEEIRKVLPLADELDVSIAFENVWNHFLLSPLEAARYVDEFESQRVGWYMDVGNIVNYGWPEQWIRILGPRVLKLDIKEFSRKLRDDQGLWKGFGAEIGEGDCNWPAVVQALDDIGYDGWASAEVAGGGRERLTEIRQRMDDVLGS